MGPLCFSSFRPLKTPKWRRHSNDIRISMFDGPIIFETLPFVFSFQFASLSFFFLQKNLEIKR